MDPITQTALLSIMNASSGHPDVVIGIIDRPIDVNHPAFETSKIKTIKESQLNTCKNTSSIACSHGT